jgi:hypothetical protein
MPHQVAPDLMAWDSIDRHCIWKRQPSTHAELEQAIRVLEAKIWAATDTRPAEYCDHARLDPKYSKSFERS